MRELNQQIILSYNLIYIILYQKGQTIKIISKRTNYKNYINGGFKTTMYISEIFIKHIEEINELSLLKKETLELNSSLNYIFQESTLQEALKGKNKKVRDFIINNALHGKPLPSESDTIMKNAKMAKDNMSSFMADTINKTDASHTAKSTMKNIDNKLSDLIKKLKIGGSIIGGSIIAYLIINTVLNFIKTRSTNECNKYSGIQKKACLMKSLDQSILILNKQIKNCKDDNCRLKLKKMITDLESKKSKLND